MKYPDQITIQEGKERKHFKLVLLRVTLWDDLDDRPLEVRIVRQPDMVSLSDSVDENQFITAYIPIEEPKRSSLVKED